uniref:Uncharacterized protein n=1 Tax=Ascaris lumbricoides TaxID=6252 RepID=A0A0M3ISL6_ASCLU
MRRSDPTRKVNVLLRMSIHSATSEATLNFKKHSSPSRSMRTFHSLSSQSAA